jgi:O-acetyl-ADP-ribose deacetylase (regulator of RNase III)
MLSRRPRELRLAGAVWPLIAAPPLPAGRSTGGPASGAEAALRLDASDLGCVLARRPRAGETLALLAARGRLRLGVGPAFELAADVAILTQDTSRVFGGSEAPAGEWNEEHEMELERLLDGLRQGLRTEPLGTVLLTQPPWSRAGHVIEAIVYDLEREPMVEEASVEAALGRALGLAEALGARSLALDALGTEYGQVTAARFLEILAWALRRHRRLLARVESLTLAAWDQRRLEQLRSALQSLVSEPGTDESSVPPH